MDIKLIIHWAAYFIVAINVAGAILVVISEDKNPIRALSWILVLFFLPVFGLILYYILGQDTQRKKYFFKRYTDNEHLIDFSTFVPQNDHKVEFRYERLLSQLKKSHYSEILHGSNVEIFTSGQAKFKTLINDLKKAKHHIHVEYFLFNKDATGNEIKKILMQKAKEGVEVRFIYENIANITVPSKFYFEMEKSGVMVAPFLKFSLPRIRRAINFRNHRKVLVIDGTIGYIGGMNIGDEYARNPNWRDTHLRIQGEGVLGLQANFLTDWVSSGKTELSDLASYFPPQKIFAPQNILQIVSSGPDVLYSSILQATVRIILEAHDFVYIQTPYFLPTESLNQALISAALSGVDVRLIVSKKSDSPYVDPAARSYYSDLLHAGMRIYEHQTKFIHAKTLVSDDYVSVIGSANMDFRSFEASFEINCYIYDKDIAAKNKAIFFEDMEGCEEIILNEWKKRPWWKRIIESFMRLFSPLM